MQVEVEVESASPQQIAVVLVSGVRVEGLTVAEVAELAAWRCIPNAVTVSGGLKK